MAAVLRESTYLRLPAEVGYRHRLRFDPNPVAGILVAFSLAAAIGGRRARMQDHQRRSPLGIELFGIADERLVQMPGKDQVDSESCEEIDRRSGTAKNPLIAEPGGRDEVVVRDHDFEQAAR